MHSLNTLSGSLPSWEDVAVGEGALRGGSCLHSHSTHRLSQVPEQCFPPSGLSVSSQPLERCCHWDAEIWAAGCQCRELFQATTSMLVKKKSRTTCWKGWTEDLRGRFVSFLAAFREQARMWPHGLKEIIVVLGRRTLGWCWRGCLWPPLPPLGGPEPRTQGGKGAWVG